MGRICVKITCIAGSIIHILWAATLIALTAVLQSDVVVKKIGFKPTRYDLIFLWIYDISLFVTGVVIFCGLIWKKQRLLSWTIILFLLGQSLAFGVIIVMLTMNRFRNLEFGSIVEKSLHASPSLVISVLAGFHCLGTFIYIVLLIICIHRLNEKYSPYWK